MVHGGRGARLPDVPQIQCKIIIPRGRYTNASDRFRGKILKKRKALPPVEPRSSVATTQVIF